MSSKIHQNNIEVRMTCWVACLVLVLIVSGRQEVHTRFSCYTLAYRSSLQGEASTKEEKEGIDINTVDVATLSRIQGISQSAAQGIINRRSTLPKGKFTTYEQLQNTLKKVGVKKTIIPQIMNQLSIEGTPRTFSEKPPYEEIRRGEPSSQWKVVWEMPIGTERNRGLMAIEELSIPPADLPRVQQISFTAEEYIDHAFFNPKWGYYKTHRVKFGEHYTTFPQSHSPVFAEMIAEQVFKMWWGMKKRQGSLKNGDFFYVIELGGGEGYLIAPGKFLEACFGIPPDRVVE